MSELDLCSYVATSVVLYGMWSQIKEFGIAESFSPSRPKIERSVMEFGLALTLVLFVFGLLSVAL